MKPDTASTTRETIPPGLCRVFFVFRFVTVDFAEAPDFERPVASLFEDRAVVVLEREEPLFAFDVVARPFLLAMLRVDDDRDLEADPLPDFADFAFDDEALDLVAAVKLLDLDFEDNDFEREPVEPADRELLAVFDRADELFGEVPLFNRDELPDFEPPADLDVVDLAVLFFAELVLDEFDFEEPLFERDAADLEADFFAFEDLPALEPFDPDFEPEDIFVVAIFASNWIKTICTNNPNGRYLSRLYLRILRPTQTRTQLTESRDREKRSEDQGK